MAQHSKKELRRDMKVVLANLDKRWAAKANAEVCSQLRELVLSFGDSPAPRHVFAWVPCFPGEIDLGMFIGEMLKSSNVYLPKLDAAGSMSFVRVYDDWASRLSAGYRGIIQPQEGYGEPFVADGVGQIVVIVPGVAFDTTGRRLGRGAGHYDRFLSSSAMRGATKIGVCWSMQLVSDVPVDSFDINMDWVCHERGALRVDGGNQ